MKIPPAGYIVMVTPSEQNSNFKQSLIIIILEWLKCMIDCDGYISNFKIN